MKKILSLFFIVILVAILCSLATRSAEAHKTPPEVRAEAYEGVFTDDSNNRLEFLPLGSGFDATVFLPNVPRLSGNARWESGILRLALTDASGHEVRATFTPTACTREDGFTLTIMQSSCPSLPAGAVFPRFFLNCGETLKWKLAHHIGTPV